MIEGVRAASNERSLNQATTIDSPPESSTETAVNSAETAPHHSPPTDHPVSQTSSTPPAAGTRRLGRFVCRQQVGQGGFGVVYRAWDPILEREVALKAPHRQGQDAPAIDRLLAEARAAARLRHSNIVAVFETGQDNGQTYIASEFVIGQSLSEIIKNHPPKDVDSIRQRVKWIIDLCRGLAYAHREGIVHRDIKPHNVLIDGDNRPQLTDFGLAVRNTTPTDTPVESRLVGTIAYMSPEQARGDQSQVGSASDQYSVGVMLFESLTGQRPIEGNSYAALPQIINAPPPLASSINPSLPNDLNHICAQVLNKAPQDRYPDCDALADDLQRWMDGELVDASHPTLWRRGVHWTKKRPQLAAWLITAASLLLLISGISITVGVQQHLQAQEALQEVQTIKAQSDAAVAEAATARIAAQIAHEQQLHLQQQGEYTSTIHQISHAIENGQIDAAHDLLDRVPWHARRIEHGLLRRWAMGTPFFLQGPIKGLAHLDWSEDGRILASCTNDGFLQFWDGTNRTHLGSRLIPQGYIRGMAFAGHLPAVIILAEKFDQASNSPPLTLSVYLVDDLIKLTEPKPLWTAAVNNIQPHPSREALAVHPTRPLAAVFGFSKSGGSGVEFWDLSLPSDQGARQLAEIPSMIAAAAFSIDGKKLGFVPDSLGSPPGDLLRSYELDLDTQTIASVIPAGPNPSAASQMAPSPTTPAEFPTPLPAQDLAPAPVPTPAAASLAPTTDPGEPPVQFVSLLDDPPAPVPASRYRRGKLLTWNGELIAPVSSTFGVSSPCAGIQCNDHEAYGVFAIANANPSEESGRLSIGMSRDQEVLPGHVTRVRCLSVRPDDECFASADERGEIRIWPLSTRTPEGAQPDLQLPNDAFADIAISPDNRFATQTLDTRTTPTTLPVWNPITGKAIHELPGHSYGITAVAFHPQDKTLLSVDGNGTARLWDLDDGTLLREWATDIERPYAALFASDAQWIAIAGGRDLKKPVPADELQNRTGPAGVITLWNPQTGERLWKTDVEGVVYDVARHANNTEILSASSEGTLGFWSAADGTSTRTIPLDGMIPVRVAVQGDTLCALTVEPCGVGVSLSDLIFQRSYGYNSFRSLIKVWQLPDATERFTLTPLPGEIFSDVDLTADSQRLLCSSTSQTSIHNTLSGARLLDLPKRTGFHEQSETYNIVVCTPETEYRTRTKTATRSVEKIRENTLNMATEVKPAEDMLVVANHGLQPQSLARVTSLRSSTPGELPGGLDATRTYFIQIVDANTWKLCSDEARTVPVDITSTGAGTLTLQIEYLVFEPFQVEEQYPVTVMRPLISSRPTTTLSPFSLPFQQARFSPDGVRIVTLSTGRAEVFESEMPDVVHEIPGEGGGAVLAVSADASRIARAIHSSGTCDTCGCTTLDVWNAVTGQMIWSQQLIGESVQRMAFDPVTHDLITTSLCPIATGLMSPAAPVEDTGAIAPSPEITPQSSVLAIRQAETGDVMHQFAGVSGKIDHLSPAREQRLLASINDRCEVQLWDLEQQALLRTWKLDTTARPLAIMLSPDATSLITQLDNETALLTSTEPPNTSRILSPVNRNIVSEFLKGSSWSGTSRVQDEVPIRSGSWNIGAILQSAGTATASPTALPPQRWLTADGITTEAWLPTGSEVDPILQFARPRHALIDSTWLNSKPAAVMANQFRGSLLIWDVKQSREHRSRFQLPISPEG